MRRSFDTMGVTATLVTDDESDADAAVELIRDYDERCTRFDDSSELMRLNHARDAIVSPLLFDVIQAAVAARIWSGGRFDPTLGDDLVRLGYDRTFAQLEPGPRPVPHGTQPGPRTVLLDRARRRIRLRSPATLDLGGIAKGHAADHACRLLGPGALVDIGGDIACSRRDDGPWVLDVEHLLDDGDAITLQLELDAGGVATSGTTYRRWDDGMRHHVLDPRTGTSAATHWSNVTVVADTCTRAEVIATTLLLTPRAECEAASRRQRVFVVATDHDGTTETFGAS